MLTSDDLDTLTAPMIELYDTYAQSIINDIARRLANGSIASAAWQLQRLSESGKMYESAIKELSKLTGKSQKELKVLFENAGVKSMKFDDAIYAEAGLKPVPLNLSPAMLEVLYAGLKKTNNVLSNFTRSAANVAQGSFMKAADLAYMQVSSGAMSYDAAIRAAIKNVARDGLDMIEYGTGHVEQLDVAMRRAVLTGVGQTTSKLQEQRAAEMGTDLVQTSAHVGARPSHAAWQGRIFSLSGTSHKYPNFYKETGYGTGPGLGGWNCRHTFYPFFEGISEKIYRKKDIDKFNNKKVKLFGKAVSAYDASQVQRAIERNIRAWKRQEQALKAAGLPYTDETAKVREWQARMRDFITQTELDRQYVREQI